MSTDISRRAILGTVGVSAIFIANKAVAGALIGTAPLFDERDDPELIAREQYIDKVTLPIWNDSHGTICLEGTAGQKKAMSWSPTGYVIVEDGNIIDRQGTL